MPRKRKGRPVHGWINLDKPAGMSSAQAVGKVRRLFDAAKAGHAGTLDPLATGVLPIALGEATKAVPYVMADEKTYRFTVRWGIATDTDDSEGHIVATSDIRPGRDAIVAILQGFIGRIEQTPPAYSALKIDGARAYDRARNGETVALKPRQIIIERLDLVGQPDADHAVFEARVGKGTYIRSLARDFGRQLGSFAHVTALRRLAVGGFRAERAISLEKLAAVGHSPTASEHLLSVETALDDIPALAVTAAEAASLRHGRSVTCADQALCRDLGEGTTIRAVNDDRLVAFAQIRDGGLRPIRVLNFD
ncbi:MAG: tRNA pseudouridine(55) synthase TruB [Stellaceae bacterium]